MATSARAVKGKGPNSSKAGRNPAKSRGGTYVGIAEQIRMCEQYVAGGPNNSIRKIAKRFKRDEATVAKIVKSETMEQMAESCKKSLIMNAAEKIVERLDYELSKKDSVNGAHVALELADRLGIAPRLNRSGILEEYLRKMRERAGQSAPPERQLPEDVRVAAIVSRLTEMTLERGRLFGMPMPELDEVKDDIPITVNVLKKEQAE
jgi:hypothetical protein